MTVNLAYIVDIASEFAGVDSARVDRLVAIAGARLPVAFWDPAQRDLGLAYLVCHMLKVDQLKGNNAVTAEAMGDLSRSYAGPTVGNMDDQALLSTAYGQQFVSLRRGQARGAVVT